MAEQITLTTPLTKPNQTLVKLKLMTISLDTKAVHIEFVGDNGEPGTADYPTPPPLGSSQPSGQTLISTLNTANLTTTSLAKRVLQRIQTDGYVGAGAVTGTPE